jgi:hypothetical protein
MPIEQRMIKQKIGSALKQHARCLAFPRQPPFAAQGFANRDRGLSRVHRPCRNRVKEIGNSIDKLIPGFPEFVRSHGKRRKPIRTLQPITHSHHCRSFML